VRSVLVPIIIAVLFTNVFAGIAGADEEPEGFVVEVVIEEAAQPIAVDFLPDGRVIYAGLDGTVSIVNDQLTPPTSFVVVTVPGSVAGEIDPSELGLTGLAVDPDFDSNGFIYVWHSIDVLGGQRLTRFTVSGDNASPESALVLWETTESAPKPSCCHVGGGLSFGPDGNLWFGIGDRWNSNHAQRPTISSGAIHRVAPDGSIPADNPFNDGAGPLVDSVYSFGHRNPFRIRWDMPSENLYVAEVGDKTWEEVNVVSLDTAGSNYEWPVCEGFSQYIESEPSLSDCDNTFIPAFMRSAVGTITQPMSLILLLAGFGLLAVLLSLRLVRRRWVILGLAAVGLLVSGLVAARSLALVDRLSVYEGPVFAYQHDLSGGDPATPDTSGGASITGGARYRGAVFPPEYDGAYFFGDFINGWISYLTFEDPESPTYHPFSRNVGPVVDVNISPDGHLYYVTLFDLAGGDPAASGSIQRVRFVEEVGP